MARKIYMQWKDPDAPICDVEGIDGCEEAVRTGDSYKLPESIQEELAALGMQEYIQIEFDLDAKTGTVLKN